MDENFQNLKSLFDVKRYSEVVKTFERLQIEERSLEDEFFYAWSLFYLRRMESSLNVALRLLSKNEIKASELLAHIVAYGFNNDIYLIYLCKNYKDNAIICDVLAVRAMKKNHCFLFEMAVNLIPNFVKKKDEDSVKFLYHVAKLLVIKGNCSDALYAIDILNGIKRSFRNDSYYKGSVSYYLSLAYEKIGDIEKAQKEIKKARSLLKISVVSDKRRKCKTRLGEVSRWGKKISRVKAY